MDGWTGTIIINILLSFVYVIFAGILTNVKPSLRHMFFGIFVVSFIRVIGLFFAQTVPIMKILSTLIVTYFSIKIAFCLIKRK